MTLITKNCDINKSNFLIYPNTQSVKLLSAILLILSMDSLAQTAIAAEATVASAVTTEVVETITPADASTALDANAVRQELAGIITSEEYARAQEVKSWQAKEKPKEKPNLSWLQKLLETIFGNTATQSSSGLFSLLFSLLLKVLLIGALIAFIIWVLHRAGYLVGWVERINKHTGRRSTSTINQPNYQQHGWEQLPAHEQIPARVKQYLTHGELIQAASLLYRGSLRWLVVTEQIAIGAANTEQQCLAQIQQLAQFKDSKPHAYISQIISLWIQTAYDEQQKQNAAQLNKQLQDCADHWLLLSLKQNSQLLPAVNPQGAS